LARPRKYGRRELKRAIDEYFAGISIDVPVTDLKGEPIINKLGEELKRTRYLVPPTVNGLCLKLGIERSTFQNYGDKKLHPELYDIVADARMRFELYLEEELITRTKGSVNGLIFNLKNNYGWKDSREVEIGKETLQHIDKPMSLSEKLAAVREAAEAAFGEENEQDEKE